MDEIKKQIATAFADVAYPGDSNLRNSEGGDEPFLLEAAFKGKQDWTILKPTFLDLAPDGFASALSFFSAAAFRFYLPAYLLTDIDGELQHTDPVFYLTYGLTDATRKVQINPKRYGEYTWYEYVRERFIGFTQSEVESIISYLIHKRDVAMTDIEREPINQALRNYWHQRADNAAA